MEMLVLNGKEINKNTWLFVKPIYLKPNNFVT
jgi:hypothetical protein